MLLQFNYNRVMRPYTRVICSTVPQIEHLIAWLNQYDPRWCRWLSHYSRLSAITRWIDDGREVILYVPNFSSGCDLTYPWEMPKLSAGTYTEDGVTYYDYTALLLKEPLN